MKKRQAKRLFFVNLILAPSIVSAALSSIFDGPGTMNMNPVTEGAILSKQASSSLDSKFSQNSSRRNVIVPCFTSMQQIEKFVAGGAPNRCDAVAPKLVCYAELTDQKGHLPTSKNCPSRYSPIFSYDATSTDSNSPAKSAPTIVICGKIMPNQQTANTVIANNCVDP